MKKLYFLLILLVFVSSSEAFASNKLCRYLLTKKQTREKLSEVQLLVAPILKFLKDPNAPQALKNRLAILFSDPGLAIHELNETTQKEWDAEDSGGFYTPFNSPILEKQDKRFKPSWNQESLDKHFSHPYEDRDLDSNNFLNFIAVPQSADAFETKVIYAATLIHELSHARFEEFTAKNFLRLSALIPKKFLWITKKGKWYVDEQFFSFLHERVAIEAEYQYLKSLYDRKEGTPLDHFKFNEEAFNSPLSEIRDRITKNVIHQYKITNPEVIKLSRYTVADILTGVPCKPWHPKNSFFTKLKEKIKRLWRRIDFFDPSDTSAEYKI